MMGFDEITVSGDFFRYASPTRYFVTANMESNFNGYFRLKDLHLDPSKTLNQNQDSGRVPPQNDNEINQGFFEEDSNLLISVFQTDPLDSHLIQNTLFYNGGYVKLTDEGILCSLDGHLIKFSPQDLVKFISRSSANISTGPISIKPLKTRPSRVKKGTVIFNEIKSKLEVYDGTEWKTLKWED